MIHTLYSQGDLDHISRAFSGGFFQPTKIDLETFFAALLIIAALGFAAAYTVNYYRRWKKFQEFEDELHSLDIDPTSQDAIAKMVKHHELEEPLEILMNDRKFDDLASKEMMRILGSPGSREAKEHFIKAVYDIRRKAFPSSYDLTGDGASWAALARR